MTSRLNILKNNQEALKSLKIIRNEKEYDVEFAIDAIELSSIQKEKLEKSRINEKNPGIEKESRNSKLTDDQFIFKDTKIIHAVI
jgi:Cu2+-containing amine oxidase